MQELVIFGMLWGLAMQLFFFAILLLAVLCSGDRSPTMPLTEARQWAQLVSTRLGIASLLALPLISLLRLVLPFVGSEHLYYLPIIAASFQGGFGGGIIAALVAFALSLLAGAASPAALSGRVICFLGAALVAAEGRRRMVTRAEIECADIGRIMTSIVSSLNLEEVISTIAERLASAMGVKACSFRLLSEEGKNLVLAGTYGLSETYLAKGPVEVAYSPVDQQVLTGRVVTVADAASDAWFQYPEEAKQEGIASVLCVPLRTSGEVVGVVRLYSERLRYFSAREVHFVTMLADQAGLAIKNARLYGDMWTRYQRLSEMERVKSEYMRKVAHELRAPLGAMQSSLQLLRKGLLGEMPERQREMVETAVRRGAGLIELLDDMLVLSRTRGGAWVSQMKELRVAEVVRKVVGLFEAGARSKRVSLEADLPSDLPTIVGYAEGLEQLFGNLVANAIRYTPRGGKVRVAAQPGSDTIRVIVTDTGIGIPEDELPNIFEEFYRAENARKFEKEGTGLGLSIVKNIVEMHGGTVSVESKVGQGTTFQVFLPTKRTAPMHRVRLASLPARE